MKYISPKCFQDFCTNQEKLIEILNHRMTGMETSMMAIKVDVGWLKKLLWAIVGISTGIFAAAILKMIGA